MFFKKLKPLTDVQLQQVSLSAIYTKQQNADFYKLVPGLGRRGKYFLDQGWGIRDEVSARWQIEYLIAEKVSADCSETETENSDFPELELEEAYRELLEAGVVRTFMEIETIGAAAWDIGRAVFLARVCFERKLLSEKDVWEYLEAAYDRASRSFDSWDGFARSYIIGRAMWSAGTGENDSLGFYNVYKWLCKDPTSPWLRVPLK